MACHGLINLKPHSATVLIHVHVHLRMRQCCDAAELYILLASQILLFVKQQQLATSALLLHLQASVLSWDTHGSLDGATSASLTACWHFMSSAIDIPL